MISAGSTTENGLVTLCFRHVTTIQDGIYRRVLISPRYANFFDPLAVCREQFKYLSYKGLAKLAL